MILYPSHGCHTIPVRWDGNQWNSESLFRSPTIRKAQNGLQPSEANAATLASLVTADMLNDGDIEPTDNMARVVARSSIVGAFGRVRSPYGSETSDTVVTKWDFDDLNTIVPEHFLVCVSSRLRGILYHFDFSPNDKDRHPWAYRDLLCDLVTLHPRIFYELLYKKSNKCYLGVDGKILHRIAMMHLPYWNCPVVDDMMTTYAGLKLEDSLPVWNLYAYLLVMSDSPKLSEWVLRCMSSYLYAKFDDHELSEHVAEMLFYASAYGNSESTIPEIVSSYKVIKPILDAYDAGWDTPGNFLHRIMKQVTGCKSSAKTLTLDDLFHSGWEGVYS